MMNRELKSVYYKVGSKFYLNKIGRGMPRFQKLGGMEEKFY